MKIHTLLYILLFFSLTNCYEFERKCADFKTGEFKSEITINKETYTSVFSRDNVFQVERYKGKIDSSKVRWINDCEVVFTTIHPKNRIDKKDVHLKILSTTENSYTFEYSYVGEVNKQKGTAVRIKS